MEKDPVTIARVRDAIFASGKGIACVPRAEGLAKFRIGITGISSLIRPAHRSRNRSVMSSKQTPCKFCLRIKETPCGSKYRRQSPLSTTTSSAGSLPIEQRRKELRQREFAWRLIFLLHVSAHAQERKRKLDARLTTSMCHTRRLFWARYREPGSWCGKTQANTAVETHQLWTAAIKQTNKPLPQGATIFSRRERVQPLGGITNGINSVDQR